MSDSKGTPTAANLRDRVAAGEATALGHVNEAFALADMIGANDRDGLNILLINDTR